MATRLEQDAKQHTEAKPAPVGIDVEYERAEEHLAELYADSNAFIRAAYKLEKLRLRLAAVEAEARAVAPLVDVAQWDAELWDGAVESLGRSAGVLEELAESTGEAIARISARGDRTATPGP
jgi:hypothetical protein